MNQELVADEGGVETVQGVLQRVMAHKNSSQSEAMNGEGSMEGADSDVDLTTLLLPVLPLKDFVAKAGANGS